MASNRLAKREKRAVAEAPDVDADLMREFWLGSTENAPKKLAELITIPSAEYSATHGELARVTAARLPT